MTIPMDEPDPKSNLIQFKRANREGSLEPVRNGYSGCQHENVTVDEATRSVACRKCKTPLDPFTVLYELAWKQRRWLEELDAWDAYRESKLAERYDLEWEERKGDVTAPPEDPAVRRVWDAFREHFHGKFCGMYQRRSGKRAGPEWYARTTDGGLYSYQYVRSQLTPKIAKPTSA